MELYIKDRLLIPGILPEQNKFMDYNLKKSIISKISISDTERKEYSLVENKEAMRIEWDMDKDKKCPLIVDFTAEEIKYLQQACEKISDSPMSDDTWNVVERIYDAAQNCQ